MKLWLKVSRHLIPTFNNRWALAGLKITHFYGKSSEINGRNLNLHTLDYIAR